MKYTELKNDIAQGDRRIYLFEGDDAYFRTHGEEQVKNAFLQLPQLNFASFDGSLLKGKALSELTSAMAACPFMAPKRVIRISQFYPTDADYEKYLKPSFENCPDTTILIIVNDGSGKGAALKRKKCVTFVDCSHADEDTVTRWVYATLKRGGIAADVAACRNVAAYCLCDMARVAWEVQKLMQYGKSNITSADVDEVVYKDADYRVYEMTDAIARKNYPRFLEICSELAQKSADRLALITALQRYYKNLLIICSSRQPAAELAAQLKMPEFAVRKSGERARALGREQLLYYSSTLYDLAARVRSGRLTADGAFFTALAAMLFA